MDDMVLHTEYHCGHDDRRKHCLEVGQFREGVVLGLLEDLGNKGTVLHETGEADHDEGPCEQTPRLGLHPARTVDSSSAVFVLLIR